MTLSDDNIPYTENVVIDFEYNRMRCTFFEEEWEIQKMKLDNLDKSYFSIFLEKVTPTAVPFTMISTVTALSKPVEQINYFDKTLTRCKIFSCETSMVQSDKLQSPKPGIHIALYPKEEQPQPGVYTPEKKPQASKVSSEESIVGWDETGIKNLSCDLVSLLENTHLTDVTLIAGDKAVGAHKCILSARSEVFKAMFEHDMAESQNNSVEIEDVDYEVLDIFVRFLYTGKFPAVTVDIASNLYIVADKYAVGELKMKCATFLCSSLTDENVLNILSFADCYSDELIKKAAVDFISENREFLITDEFFSFRDKCPKLACEVYSYIAENVKHAFGLPVCPKVGPKQVYHQRLRFPEIIRPPFFVPEFNF